VPKKPVPVAATLTPAARQDIRDISRWSELKFGKEAATRYRALLSRALRDLEADPARPGSKERPELMVPGARTYHLSFSRSRAERPGVKRPRHFILYRSTRRGFIEIARILHDSSDLNRHLPEGYQPFTGEVE
jgi:toxin ParE1/3/4